MIGLVRYTLTTVEKDTFALRSGCLWLSRHELRQNDRVPSLYGRQLQQCDEYRSSGLEDGVSTREVSAFRVASVSFSQIAVCRHCKDCSIRQSTCRSRRANLFSASLIAANRLILDEFRKKREEAACMWVQPPILPGTETSHLAMPRTAWLQPFGYCCDTRP